MVIKLLIKFKKSKEIQKHNNSETVANEAENIGTDRETQRESHKYLQKEDKKFLMIWDYYNNIIMEYQEKLNLLDNTPNQPIKFPTKSWINISSYSLGTYTINSQIKFKHLMIRSSLCDYGDAEIVVKGNIIVVNTTAAAATAAATNNVNKMVIFKNFVPFTDCIGENNNT